MLAQLLAMIGGDHDDGVVSHPIPLQSGYHLGDQIVGVADLTVIEVDGAVVSALGALGAPGRFPELAYHAPAGHILIARGGAFAGQVGKITGLVLP